MQYLYRCLYVELVESWSTEISFLLSVTQVGLSFVGTIPKSSENLQKTGVHQEALTERPQLILRYYIYKSEIGFAMWKL